MIQSINSAPVLVAPTKLAGSFVAEVRNAGVLREVVKIDNKLLDPFFFSWLSGAASSANYFSYCGLGTDTNPVGDGDTSITPTAHPRVNGASYEPIQTLALNQWKSGRSYTFPIMAAPVTINKFGIYNVPTAGVLSAAALLPAPLNLIIGDILTVKHYITATVDLADRTGTLTLDGVSCPYTMRWFNLDTAFTNGFLQSSPWNLHTGWNIPTNTFGYDSSIHFRQNQTLVTNTQDAFSSIPATAGDTSGSATIVAAAYTSGNFYRDIEYTVPYNQGGTPAGAGNLIFNIASVYSSPIGFVLNFAGNRVPKTTANTHEFKIAFRHSWGR